PTSASKDTPMGGQASCALGNRA
ncbi:unnamed protein product, partial [Fusarium fujikuroi]